MTSWLLVEWVGERNVDPFLCRAEHLLDRGHRWLPGAYEALAPDPIGMAGAGSRYEHCGCGVQAGGLYDRSGSLRAAQRAVGEGWSP